MRNGGNEKASDWEQEKLNPAAKNGRSQSVHEEFNVVRRVYHQDTLNRDADYQVPNKPLSEKCKKVIRMCGIDDCILNSIPLLRWLPRYKTKDYLVGDMVAGATTAVMHIPQGMAYALLAEVPPIVGLYMAFFPVLIYVIFGTSPHVSMGTFAVACLMAGKVVNQHSGNITTINSIGEIVETPSPYTPLQVLSVVCFTVGTFQLIMWVFRLGAVSTLLSEPLVSGFTTAASFHVLASQLKDLFGVRIPKTNGYLKIVYTVFYVGRELPNTNIAAFIISFITCTTIACNNELLKPWVSKRSRVPVPIELLAIVLGTVVSRFGQLKETYGISLVGNIPTGLPVPEVPTMKLLPEVAIDAFTITMVTYTISMSMALIFAAKDKYDIDANQELLALGASNIFGSFFGCAPFCASLSRSNIQYQAGAKTQVTSVISALLILCVLLWVGPFFEKLPRSVLAAIIVVSLKMLFMQVTELPKFWRLSKLDAIVWLVTFLTTMLIQIDIGLGAGLLASLGALFVRSQRPYTCLLGRVLNTDLYLDTKRYRAAEELPGIKIFHYCGGLNFATKNLFRSTLFRKIGYMKPAEGISADEDHDLTRSESYEWDPTLCNRIHCVVIDASALSYLDAPGVKMLINIHKELQTSHINVLLSGANGPVLEMINRYNKLETERLQLDTFPTVHDAIVFYNAVEAKKIPITIAEELPGIKIFHYCGGLNFATKNLFRSTLFRKIGYMKPAEGISADEDHDLTRSESYEWDPTLCNRIHCVVIDASALSYLDAPGVKMLINIHKELQTSHINVLLSGANGPVLEMINRYNKLETERLQLDTFPTVHDAIVFYNAVEAKKIPITIVSS